MLSSQEMGSSLITILNVFWIIIIYCAIIYEASTICAIFNFHELSSRILLIPEFNLVIHVLNYFLYNKKALWYTKINYWMKEGIKVTPKAAQIAKVMTRNQSLFQGSTKIKPDPYDIIWAIWIGHFPWISGLLSISAWNRIPSWRSSIVISGLQRTLSAVNTSQHSQPTLSLYRFHLVYVYLNPPNFQF